VTGVAEQYTVQGRVSITRRVFSNVFWLVLSEVTSKSLIFLGTVYLARELGKAGFGLFSLSLAVGVYFWVVSDAGVTGYGVRGVAQNKEQAKELYNTLNSLRLVLSVILLLFFYVVLYFTDTPPEKKLVLLAGAFYGVAYSVSSDWVFRGMEKMQYIFAGRITASLAFLGGIYLLVDGPSGTVAASFIYSCSVLAGSLVFLFILSRKLGIPFVFRISFREWGRHLRESFYFAINGIFNNLSLFIPVFFMGFLSSDEDLGIFSAPHRLATMIISGGALVIIALYPTLSSLYVADRERFRKLHREFERLILGIAMPLCIIASVFSRDIVVFLFGKPYTDSAGIFNILIWLVFLLIVRRSIGTSLISAGFHRFNMFATGGGAAVVILLSTVLIPVYSGYGAAAALTGGEVFILILMSELFRRKVYRSGFLSSFVKVFLMGAIMTALFMILPFPRVVNVLIGLSVYTVLAFYSGILNKKTFGALMSG